MSQLVKAITAVDTGQRKQITDSFSPLFNDVFLRKELLEDSYHNPAFVAKLYKIGITLGAQAIVNEADTINDVDALSLAIERTKRSVIEAVFGEFRQDFLQINNALYDRDFQKARSLLTVFEQKMFEA